MSHSATPPAVEDCRRTIEHTAAAIGILQPRRSGRAPITTQERLAELTCQKEEAEKTLD